MFAIDVVAASVASGAGRAAAAMEEHLRQLETLGYTVIPAAVSADQLLQIRAAYDRVVDAIRRTKPKSAWSLVKLPRCLTLLQRFHCAVHVGFCPRI